MIHHPWVRGVYVATCDRRLTMWGSRPQSPDGARIARRASLTSARGPSALLEQNTDGEDNMCLRWWCSHQSSRSSGSSCCLRSSTPPPTSRSTAGGKAYDPRGLGAAQAPAGARICVVPWLMMHDMHDIKRYAYVCTHISACAPRPEEPSIP